MCLGDGGFPPFQICCAIMDNKDSIGSAIQDAPEELPSIFRDIQSNGVAGFDTTCSPRGYPAASEGAESPNCLTASANVYNTPSPNLPVHMIRPPHHSPSVSISMPTSPTGVDQPGSSAANLKPNLAINCPVVNLQAANQAKFHSQPMAAGTFQAKGTPERKGLDLSGNQQRIPRNSRLKDHSYNSFKTWSGALERQISTLRGKPPEPQEVNGSKSQPEPVPAPDRYFDALEGPELETLRASEVLVLPEDKLWPFLLRFPISSFGMCLGVSSQAILWKTLATSSSTVFLHVSPIINLVLWCISLALMGTVAFIYSLKIIFYFEAVRREYYHPIRVNFFFAPWITCLFLTLGLPPIVAVNLHAAVWYVLMAPILCLELKLYGQWMSGGKRRLSKVANPSNHLAIVGNFVGALLGASMGLKEGPIFFFAVGLAHYSVLFVTLYQRLPTNETLPKELHPVFFLFVAAPSVASMAWATIAGEFDYSSRIAYFIALFLYVSLAVRINFFRGFRFSLAWWAYTFPMTGASIATIRYSAEVKNVFTQSLSVALSGISALTVIALLVSTIIHAFVLNDLFPNDISIAISDRRPKGRKRRTHTKIASSDVKDTTAAHLTNASSDIKEIGAAHIANTSSDIKEIGAFVSIDIRGR
ncbi:S-type anion channel SLAH2 isoform X1 [Elaeis guineensis]|uniref:S-type anion channel SLAH2 isoform X1 n=2 Tax=Elaeis guineensis var. tenera TaxID=51953 RepID=A0A6I9QV00_ELAGV|nr:S-type anion channel SLAH2 isoform X1 [Elaeis guineensis]